MTDEQRERIVALSLASRRAEEDFCTAAIDSQFSAADTRVCYARAEDAYAALMAAIWELDAAERPAIAESEWQYYAKDHACKAISAFQADCICWRTERTGPFADRAYPDDRNAWRRNPTNPDGTVNHDRL